MRDGTVTGYTYSPFGSTGDSITVDDEVVSASTIEYTSTGAVRSVTLDGVTVSYTYDSRGQQKSYTDGFVKATYAYNPSGLRSSKTVDGVTTNLVYNGS